MDQPGTCDTCAHWDPQSSDVGYYGESTRWDLEARQRVPLIPRMPEGSCSELCPTVATCCGCSTFITPATFGCVLWKERSG
jgi:hypothetical protein